MVVGPYSHVQYANKMILGLCPEVDCVSLFVIYRIEIDLAKLYFGF